MKITLVSPEPRTARQPQAAAPTAAAPPTTGVTGLVTPAQRSQFASTVKMSRVFINGEPTHLESLVKGGLLLLHAAWRLGPPTLFGMFLVGWMIFLARLGGVITNWVIVFGVLAGCFALLLRMKWLRRGRMLLGAVIAVLTPIPIVLGVYWQTATPSTLGWLFAVLGGIATAALPIILIFVPDLVAWVQRRLIVGVTPAGAGLVPPAPTATLVEGEEDVDVDAVQLPARVLFGWIGAVAGPIVLAWMVVTALHWALEILPGWVTGLYVSSSHHAAHQAFEAERQRRQQLAATFGRTVAVTLSGGGYRAAATHAGLLAMLDAAAIPVSVLSTVSGGSITGAAYAQGWTPDCFADQLRRQKPGLPDDLLSMTAIVGDLARRDWGTGDVYATHFGRRYFHDHTMAETGPPDLVVNLTEYETGERVAIMKGQDVAATKKSADPLHLRTIVAASGAFPVAFRPVSIYGARYVDGGVVENVGVTGLAQYVAATGRVPAVVVVSDLSAEPHLPHQSYKASLFQMAVQAPDLTSRALHQILYRTYSNGKYDRAARTLPQQPYRIERSALWPGVQPGPVSVFFLAPTSPAERDRFAPGADQQRVAMVAGLKTLQELEPEQVDAAFWAGAALARSYLPEIRRVLGKDPAPLPPVPSRPAASCPR